MYNPPNITLPTETYLPSQLNMSLGEASARCEALQDALVRADLKCTQLSTRNDELEDHVKQVSKIVMLREGRPWYCSLAVNITLHQPLTDGL